MARVTLSINGRPYNVACEDGQEESLTALGEKLDSRVRTMKETVGQVSDPLLLVMVSLTLLDELQEVEKTAVPSAAGEGGLSPELEEQAARTVELLAARVESVAARLHEKEE